MCEAIQKLVRTAGVGYCVADFSRACLIRLIDYPELPLRTNTHETIKAGGTALLVRTEFPVGQKRVAAAYKRLRRRNWWKVLTALPRTNRLLHTWRLGHELRRRGVATPRPLAVIVPRRRDPGRPAYVAVEWIAGASNVRQFVEYAERLESPMRRPLVDEAATALGKLLGRMHAAGITHRDLKATNLLVRPTAGGCESYVIDLDGARRRRALSWNRRWRDLGRFVASLADSPVIGRTAGLRFLKAYLACSNQPCPDWKEAWRELEQRVASRRRRRAA